MELLRPVKLKHRWRVIKTEQPQDKTIATTNTKSSKDAISVSDKQAKKNTDGKQPTCRSGEQAVSNLELEEHQNSSNSNEHRSNKSRKRKRREIEDATEQEASQNLDRQPRSHRALDDGSAQQYRSNNAESHKLDSNMMDTEVLAPVILDPKPAEPGSNFNSRKRRQKTRKKSSNVTLLAQGTPDTTPKDKALLQISKSSNTEQDHLHGGNNNPSRSPSKTASSAVVAINLPQSLLDDEASINGTNVRGKTKSQRTNERKKKRRQAAKIKAESLEASSLDDNATTSIKKYFPTISFSSRSNAQVDNRPTNYQPQDPKIVQDTVGTSHESPPNSFSEKAMTVSNLLKQLDHQMGYAPMSSAQSLSSSSSVDLDSEGEKKPMATQVGKYQKALVKREQSPGFDVRSSSFSTRESTAVSTSPSETSNLGNSNEEHNLTIMTEKHTPNPLHPPWNYTRTHRRALHMNPTEYPDPRPNNLFSLRYMSREQAEKAADHAIEKYPFTKRDGWTTAKYCFEKDDEEAEQRRALLQQSMVPTPSTEYKKRKPNANRMVGSRKLGEFDEEDQAAITAFEVKYCAEHGLSKAEWIAKIHQRAKRYEGLQFWKEFAENVPGRGTVSLQQHCRRRYLSEGTITTLLTEKEDNNLLQLVDEYGPLWATIAKKMNRSKERLYDHWRRVLKDRDKAPYYHPWTDQEEEELKQTVGRLAASALAKNPDTTNNLTSLFTFSSVSKEIPNHRIYTQCYRKWHILLWKGKTTLAEQVELAAERMSMKLDPALIDRVAPDKYAEFFGKGQEDAAANDGEVSGKEKTPSISLDQHTSPTSPTTEESLSTGESGISELSE